MWSFVILFIIGINFFACYKTFDYKGFYYYHVCPPWEQIHPFGQVLKIVRNILTIQSSQFSAYASSYLPVVMFVIYIFMIVYIKIKLDFDWIGGRLVRKKAAAMSTDNAKSWKTEFNLLAQVKSLFVGRSQINASSISTSVLG